MTFTDTQRAQIRIYMGIPKMFQGQNPILENAMNTIDGIQDSGATQTSMVVALLAIAGIEAQIATYQKMLIASEVTGEVRFDAARAIAVLRQEGTTLINQIAFPLSMSPARAYFYPTPVDDSGNMVLYGYR